MRERLFRAGSQLVPQHRGTALQSTNCRRLLPGVGHKPHRAAECQQRGTSQQLFSGQRTLRSLSLGVHRDAQAVPQHRLDHPSATEEPQGVCRDCTAPVTLRLLPVPRRAGDSALGTSCRHGGLQDAILLNMLVPHRPPGARNTPRRGGTPLAGTASTLLEQHVQHTAVEEQAHRRAQHKALMAPVGHFQLRGNGASLSCCYF